MLVDYAVSALLTLFVVVDPIGLAPTFLAVTDGLPRTARRSVGGARQHHRRRDPDRRRARSATGCSARSKSRWRRSASPAACCCSRSRREMVFGVRMRREGEAAEQAVEEHVRNIAAFPLAIPLLAGPGAITATVLLAGRAGGKPSCNRNSDCCGGACRRFLLDHFHLRRAHQRAARHDREYRAVAAARRAAWRRLPCNMWSTASAAFSPA